MEKICEHVEKANLNKVKIINNPNFECTKEIFDLSHEWAYLLKCKKCGTHYLYYCEERGFEDEYIVTTLVALGKKNDISCSEVRDILAGKVSGFEIKVL